MASNFIIADWFSPLFTGRKMTKFQTNPKITISTTHFKPIFNKAHDWKYVRNVTFNNLLAVYTDAQSKSTNSLSSVNFSEQFNQHH